MAAKLARDLAGCKGGGVTPLGRPALGEMLGQADFLIRQPGTGPEAKRELRETAAALALARQLASDPMGRRNIIYREGLE